MSNSSEIKTLAAIGKIGRGKVYDSIVETIANTPLVLRKSGIEAPAVGEIVRIRTIGTAHVLAAG